ncbi:MAG: aryl-sulfate sulfotransferase [Chitinophagales bacterium]|nr:aryl-sulfate sulfotransferase [Chitinophagales bacterium]
MKPILFLLSFCTFILNVHAQDTIGVRIYSPEVEDGYVLFSPVKGDTTYLIDKCGRRIHQWPTNTNAGLCAYLFKEGYLYRGGRVSNDEFADGAEGGLIEIISWEGNKVWQFKYSNDKYCQHHDIQPLDNGNVLLVSYEYHTAQDAIANGRKPTLIPVGGGIWCDKIVELKPTGFNTADTVWEWSSWNHLIQGFDDSKLNFGIVKNHPELIDINYGIRLSGLLAEDWQHFNTVKYNPKYDQIMVSARQFNEIYIIDHSTTTQEAAGHTGGRYGKGGDILYRWGNDAAFKRAGEAERHMFLQHYPVWIPEDYPYGGQVMYFNNQHPGNGFEYSSVDIIDLPQDTATGFFMMNADKTFGPDTLSWTYFDTTHFFSTVMSSAQMLRNGNVLICEGQPGRLFEINPNKEIVWEYVNPVGYDNKVYEQYTHPVNNMVFIADHIYADDIRLSGRDLTPKDPIEINPNPLPSLCAPVTNVSNVSSGNKGMWIYPNPSNGRFSFINYYSIDNAYIQLTDILGKVVFSENKPIQYLSENTIQVDLKSGIYLLQIFDDNLRFLEQKCIIIQ